MAVLGNFSPKVGKCFYEMQVKADTMKWDVSFTTEKFELLVSKVGKYINKYFFKIKKKL